MKVKARMVFEWVDDIDSHFANDMVDYRYAPHSPPKKVWPSLFKAYLLDVKGDYPPDSAKCSVTVKALSLPKK